MSLKYASEDINPAITGIGKAVPKYRQNQAQVYNMICKRFGLTRAQQRILNAIYEEAGVEYRHSVLSDFVKVNEIFSFFPNTSDGAFPSTEFRMKIYKENALELALEAVNDCFSAVNIKLEEITHVITVSCTGMSAPGLDMQLVEKLGLLKSIHRTVINFMGCYALFNGMKMAHAICKGDEKAKVLVVSVELCTLHFQKNFSLDNLISSTIFSDGAGAILIENKAEHKKRLSFCDFYCDILPNSDKEMTWEIGDQGFDIRLSSYVPHLIELGIGRFFEKFLSCNRLSINNIGYFAIHPGSKKILEGCEKALNIRREDNRFSYNVLREYGNMSSATIAFVLKDIWDTLQEKDDEKKIFSCAFGPGLTLESMILQVNNA